MHVFLQTNAQTLRKIGKVLNRVILSGYAREESVFTYERNTSFANKARAKKIKIFYGSVPLSD